MTFDEEYMMIDDMYREQELERIRLEEEEDSRRTREFMFGDESYVYYGNSESVREQQKTVMIIAVIIFVVCGICALGLIILTIFFFIFGPNILYNLMF